MYILTEGAAGLSSAIIDNDEKKSERMSLFFGGTDFFLYL